ncbi:MAG: hypothetical protein JWN70_1384 [Planctomycetaceae bacterium]|nr:hypothetical protein [Planctomycetaceae bacterium]
MNQLISELRGYATYLGPELSPTAAEIQILTALPSSHSAALHQLNGFAFYAGAFRIFGLGSDNLLNLTSWNESSTWRFAWDERVDPYFVFGETAWGDQYAYKSVDGRLGSEVYFLESNLLRPTLIADTFDQFLEEQVMSNAVQPHDTFLSETVERFGAIDLERHWALAPSLIIGGPEDLDNVIELPARTAMIFAGDIALGLSKWPEGDSVPHVVPWRDVEGRDRLSLKFETLR